MTATTTSIAWTDRTWNPLRGCTIKLVRKTSQGWKWTGEVRLIEKDLDAPLRWKKPRRIFVNSMSDVFYEQVPNEWIDKIFAVMALAPQHQFQVLTKRADRMYTYFTQARFLSSLAEDIAAEAMAGGRVIWDERGSNPDHYRTCQGGIPQPAQLAKRWVWPGWPLPNVSLGVSVENQATADERIPWLLQTPAAVRFVSYEPALGTVDFRPYMPKRVWHDLPSWQEPAINWLICGGESGPQSRPCDAQWLRSVVQQCQQAGVPCFVKQLGAHAYQSARHEGSTGYMLQLQDRKGADPTEWPEDLRVQQSVLPAKADSSQK